MIGTCQEPRRNSTQRRCMELQLEQYEEELRGVRETLVRDQEALREERENRLVAEQMLREKDNESRQHERRLMEWQRDLATAAKQREEAQLEQQRTNEERRRQDEKNLAEKHAHLESDA